LESLIQPSVSASQNEAGEGVYRKTADSVNRKFGKENRDWLVNLYGTRPLLFLVEAKSLFELEVSSTNQLFVSNQLIQGLPMSLKVRSF
jgi:hypothetical protein